MHEALRGDAEHLGMARQSVEDELVALVDGAALQCRRDFCVAGADGDPGDVFSVSEGMGQGLHRVGFRLDSDKPGGLTVGLGFDDGNDAEHASTAHSAVPAGDGLFRHREQFGDTPELRPPVELQTVHDRPVELVHCGGILRRELAHGGKSTRGRERRDSCAQQE